MIWSCAELVHFFSVNFTLQPGMTIITGTPAGTSWSVDADLGGKWTPAPGLVAATRYCLPGGSLWFVTKSPQLTPRKVAPLHDGRK